MISRFGFIIRKTIRISPENTTKLCKVLEAEAREEVELVRTEYEQKLKVMEETYKKHIAEIKNESIESMIRRIAKEEIGKEIKSNLTVEEKFDPYDGRHCSTWHLEWGGEEF